LRRYASLDRRVVLEGQGRKLELWDEARWQAQVAQTIAFPGALPPELEGLSL
jgi:MraZ protein